MADQKDIAEVGLAHPLGAHLMLSKIGTIIVYDPSLGIIAELQRQFADHPAFNVQWHDPVGGPTPQMLDAIYSIDFIQYLTRDQEEAFFDNLRLSLRHDFGVALIGCPSFGGTDDLLDRPSTGFYHSRY
jgi:hypothetical protein